MRNLSSLGIILSFFVAFQTGESMEHPSKRKIEELDEERSDNQTNKRPNKQHRSSVEEKFSQFKPKTRFLRFINGLDIPKEARKILGSLESRPNLKRLRLISREEKDFKIQEGVSHDTLNELAFSLKRHTNITSLHLVRYNIFSEGAEIISRLVQDRFLEGNPLKELKLKDVCLQPAGLQWVASSSFLSHLSLPKSNLGDEDVKALTLSFLRSNNTHLQTLSLNGNRITKSGAQYLAALLVMNATLKELNLENNLLPPESVEFLGASLKQQSERESGLEKLQLGKNNLGDRGILLLIPYLSQARHLRKLGLRKIGLKEKGAQALLDAAQSRSLSHIRKVGLRDNPKIIKIIIEDGTEEKREDVIYIDDSSNILEDIGDFNEKGGRPRLSLGY